MVVHTCKPSSWEVETGGQLQGNFKTARLCLKTVNEAGKMAHHIKSHTIGLLENLRFIPGTPVIEETQAPQIPHITICRRFPWVTSHSTVWVFQVSRRLLWTPCVLSPRGGYRQAWHGRMISGPASRKRGTGVPVNQVFSVHGEQKWRSRSKRQSIRWALWLQARCLLVLSMMGTAFGVLEEAEREYAKEKGKEMMFIMECRKWKKQSNLRLSGTDNDKA